MEEILDLEESIEYPKAGNGPMLEGLGTYL